MHTNQEVSHRSQQRFLQKQFLAGPQFSQKPPSLAFQEADVESPASSSVIPLHVNFLRSLILKSQLLRVSGHADIYAENGGFLWHVFISQQNHRNLCEIFDNGVLLE